MCGLLSIGQSPLPGFTVAAPAVNSSTLTQRGLALCTDLLEEHVHRRRILNEAQFEKMETTLSHSLNSAHQARDMPKVVEVAVVFVRMLDAAASAPLSTGSIMGAKPLIRAQVLTIHADALLSQSRLAEAAENARRSFHICPTVDAFGIMFQAAVCGGNATVDGSAYIQV